MKGEKIGENLRDVIGIGLFVVGIISVLKKGFTLLASAWFILGCLWMGLVVFRALKSAYTAHVLFFSLFFILGYVIGSILGIYEFKPIGFLYWYFGGVIVGSGIYFMHKKKKKEIR